METTLLRGIVKGEVQSDTATLTAYSRDASLFEIQPQVVVYPKDTADIKALMRYVLEHKKDDPTLSITMRAAGTDMSGGPINDSIIVDTTKHMNHIISVDKETAIAEPGVYYRDFEKQTLAKQLIMPAYTASKSINALGGMVGNNSGGEKSIKYGKVENYVQSQKVIFSDGNEYTILPLTRTALDQKMAQGDFEGNLYKQLFELIQSNYELIRRSKPTVTKNSAGYYLWNVWNSETEVFDLNKLIVGSQGTLALTTEITFGLVPVPKYSMMVVVYMNSIDRLGEVVDTVMRYEPESFESYDDYSMKLAIKFAGDFFKTLGFWGAIKLGLQFIPDLFRVLTGGVPKLILMAEVTGDDRKVLYERAKSIKQALNSFSYQTSIAMHPSEIEKYWKVRRESFNLLRNHVKGKRTAPFIDDIIVDPHKMPEFLPKLQLLLAEYDLVYTIAGHAGNGNFHIIPLMDLENPLSSDIILDLSKKVYQLVAEFRGSITAEHNDGIIRTPFLPYMYSPEIIDLFKKTKQIFDPQNIFNPGKKVGGSFTAITTYLIKGHHQTHSS